MYRLSFLCVLVAVSITSQEDEARSKSVLSYAEALHSASRGRIDQDILFAFRKEHAEAANGGLDRQVAIKVNLAALLLDIGNSRAGTNENYKEEIKDLYRECIKLSKEALDLNPRNENAKKNLEAARRNLRLHNINDEDVAKVENSKISKAKGKRQLVVASLTTIPSRIDHSCRLAIDSLLPQVSKVYLSIANHYERFGPISLPAYLRSEPYSSRVIVTVGSDNGAASKYLGSLSAIPPTGWVFVGDDDQEYRPGLVARMLSATTPANGGQGAAAAYQNNLMSIRAWCDSGWANDGGPIRGYVGVLVHASLLAGLPAFPLPSAGRFADDQWMSIYLFLRGAPVLPTGAEGYSDIFAGKVGSGSHALEMLGGRAERIRELEAVFRVRFEGWRVRRWAPNEEETSERVVFAADGYEAVVGLLPKTTLEEWYLNTQRAKVPFQHSIPPEQLLVHNWQAHASAPAWQYHRAVCTGLGDRLGAMLTLAALAYSARTMVEMEWCSAPPLDVLERIRPTIPGWAGYSYPLDSFLRAFTTPSNVRLIAAPGFAPDGPKVSHHGNQQPAEEGRDQLYSLAWLTTRLRDPVEGADFARAYHVVGAALQARSPPRAQRPYVVLHMRALDTNTPDFYGVTQAYFCTRQAVKALVERGITVLVISNNVEWAAADLGEDSGAVVLPPTATAYDDMSLLLSADGIIQHCRFYSSFSSVPAMARGIPHINTYSGPTHRYELFREAGSLPAEFHTCSEQDLFVNRIVWRIRNRY